MIQRRHKPYAPYIYHESSKNGCPIGSVSNKYTASKKSRFYACISSRITTVIQITSDHQINYNCFNEPFAVSTCKDLYWDMHGLIFETSIWLLAGSTRFLLSNGNQRSRLHGKRFLCKQRKNCKASRSWLRNEILISNKSTKRDDLSSKTPQRRKAKFWRVFTRQIRCWN